MALQKLLEGVMRGAKNRSPYGSLGLSQLA